MDIFCSEKGAGHFENQGGDTVCCSTLTVVLLPWSAVLQSPSGEEPGRCSCPLWFKKTLDHRVATLRAAANARLRCTGPISCSQVLQMISVCTVCVKQLPCSRRFSWPLPKWQGLSRMGNLNVCHNPRKMSSSLCRGAVYHPLNTLTLAIFT